MLVLLDLFITDAKRCVIAQPRARPFRAFKKSGSPDGSAPSEPLGSPMKYTSKAAIEPNLWPSQNSLTVAF